MIGLVRVLPPPGGSAGSVVLDTLPEPPASRFAGFMVSCRDAASVVETLNWYARVHEHRPSLPLGMVATLTDAGHHLARFDHGITVLLEPGQLVAGGAPDHAFDLLRTASVEGRVFENTFGNPVLEERETLEALIARAVGGGTVERAARDLGITSTTLRARLSRLDLSPGELKRSVRSGRSH